MPDKPVAFTTLPAQSEIVYAALKLLRGEDYLPRPQPKGFRSTRRCPRAIGTYQLGLTATRGAADVEPLRDDRLPQAFVDQFD